MNTGSPLSGLGHSMDKWKFTRELNTALESASAPAMGLSPLLPLASTVLLHQTTLQAHCVLSKPARSENAENSPAEVLLVVGQVLRDVVNMVWAPFRYAFQTYPA